MKSNIDFDSRLLKEALKVGKHRYKKDAINAALKEYVERHQKQKILDLFGTVKYADDYDFKKLRNRK